MLLCATHIFRREEKLQWSRQLYVESLYPKFTSSNARLAGPPVFRSPKISRAGGMIILWSVPPARLGHFMKRNGSPTPIGRMYPGYTGQSTKTDPDLDSSPLTWETHGAVAPRVYFICFLT